MDTLPTLNSRNFKQVKCPTCEKYPERVRSRRWKPEIRFAGIRWDAEGNMLELQGHCVNCSKEFRVLIKDIGPKQLHGISIFNPKSSEHVGPIEEHLKRWT